MKECSSPEAEISYTTCTRLRGVVSRSSPSTGQCASEERARELLLAGAHDPLIAYETLGHDVILSIPKPDHYLPLLYVIAQRREGEPISFPVEGFDGGSVSMLSVQIG